MIFHDNLIRSASRTLLGKIYAINKEGDYNRERKLLTVLWYEKKGFRRKIERDECIYPRSRFASFFPLHYICDTDAANFLVHVASHICRLWSHIGVSNLLISPNIPTNHILSIKYYSPSFSLGFTISRTDRSFHEENNPWLQLFFLEQ